MGTQHAHAPQHHDSAGSSARRRGRRHVCEARVGASSVRCRHVLACCHGITARVRGWQGRDCTKRPGGGGGGEARGTARLAQDVLDNTHAAAAVEEAAAEEAEGGECRVEAHTEHKAPHVEPEESAHKVGDANKQALEPFRGRLDPRYCHRQADNASRRHQRPERHHPSDGLRPLRRQQACAVVRQVIANRGGDPAQGGDKREYHAPLKDPRRLPRILDRKHHQHDEDARQEQRRRVRQRLDGLLRARVSSKW